MKKNHFIKSLLILGLVLTTQVVFAQAGDGGAGIAKASSMITGYLPAIQKLVYAIGAVVGFIGAITVYSKWNSGDQDTQKAAVKWFGSMIFLVIVGVVIGAFFGVTV
jgi:phage-related minor tail protein